MSLELSKSVHAESSSSSTPHIPRLTSIERFLKQTPLGTYIALIVAHVDVIGHGDEAIQLIKGLGQLLGKVRGAGILKALDQTIRAARVQATPGVCCHRVDEGSMCIQLVLGVQFCIPNLQE